MRFYQLITGILILTISPFITANTTKNRLFKPNNPSNKIFPTSILRGYDPITIFFKSSPGPIKGGPADNPGKLFKISPQHPGEYIWRDASTLQFMPSEPWKPLTRYKISSNNSSYKLTTMMEPPEKVTPSPGSYNLKPFREFLFSFKGKISPEKLSMMITLELQPLSRGETSWLSFRDFSIKEMEKSSIKDSSLYLLTLRKPIYSGTEITLHMRLSLDSKAPDSTIRYRYRTTPPFRVLSVNSGRNSYPLSKSGSKYTREQSMDCGSGRQELSINFSKELHPSTSLEQIKDLIRFSPSVSDLKYRIAKRKIILNFKTQRGKIYKLSLKHTNMRSSDKKPLENFADSYLYFRFSKKNPYLRWSSGNRILERFGPQIIPMEGRNRGSVDLRIYRIDPLNRNFWPFPQSPITVDENLRPPGPGEEPGYGKQLVNQIKLLGSPIVSELIKLPKTANQNRSFRFGLPVKDLLTRISGANSPGTYLVGIRSSENKSKRYYIRFQVTDLCLTVIENERDLYLAVTSLKTGAPVPDASVKIEGTSKGNRMLSLIEGKTDSEGIFRYKHLIPLTKKPSRIVVQKSGDTLTINPLTPPPSYMDNHWYYNWNRWLEWLSFKPSNRKKDSEIQGIAFTERPVYKPGETIHIKTYAASRKNGGILALKNSVLSIQINGPGNRSWKFTGITSNYGTLYKKFAPKNPPTGNYYLFVNHIKKGITVASANFRIENYRIPGFEIRLTGPDKGRTDSPVKVNLNASYYAGGPVINRKVNWKVNRRFLIRDIPDFKGFTFSSQRKFSRQFTPQKLKTLSKQTSTNSEGLSSITIDPSLDPSPQSRTYIFEATIQGADQQTVTAIKSVKIYSPFLLGIKVPKLIKNSLMIEPEIVVLDHLGKLHKNRDLTLTLYHRQWHSHLKESDFTTGKTRYTTDIVDKKIVSRKLSFKGKSLKIPLKVKEAGVYIVELSARDKLGRRQKVTVDLFVKGETQVSWEKSKSGIFSVTTVKGSYPPGETAEVVLKSPYQRAKVLAIAEKPGAVQFKWLEIKKGQGLYKIIIDEKMAPNITVHFLLMKGRSRGKPQSKGEDRNRPVTLAATTQIKVENSNNRMDIYLEHKKTCLPASKLKIKIGLKDTKKAPLNGEVTLWLVDRAVLALGREMFRSPLSALIKPNRSWIRVRGTRNSTTGYISPEEVAGGDGMLRESMAAPKLFKKETVRKNFITVPYFNPSIIVENGVGEIEIDMPDNLTDFAIRGIATDGKKRYGIKSSTVSVRLPLILQPALPRFIRPGDRFKGGAIGRAVEGENSPGSVSMETEGIEISDKNSYPVQWIKNIPVKLFFNFNLTPNYKPSNVAFKASVIRDTDNAKDAFKITIPVKPDRFKRKTEKFLTLKSGEKFTIPELKGSLKGSLKRKITVSSNQVFLKAAAALNYLGGYNHSCTEQRISRLMPHLELQDILKKLQIDKGKEEFANSMARTFKHLEQCIDKRGLFSYWPGSRGYVNLTATVVDFLLLADKRGFTFNQSLLKKGIKALKESLRSDYPHFIKGEEYTERVMALHTLSKTGFYDPSYGEELYRSAQYIDLKSEAAVLLTLLKRAPEKKSWIRSLVKNLISSVRLKVVDGVEMFDKFNTEPPSYKTRIPVNFYEKLAWVTMALNEGASDSKEAKALTRYLIQMGGATGWESTRANAAVLLCLTKFMEKSSEKAISLQLTEASQTKKEEFNSLGVITDYSSQQKDLTLSSPSTKKLYAWISTEYLPEDGVESLKPENRGFVINRHLKIFNPQNSLPVRKNLKAGENLKFNGSEIVEEEITVINPENRDFVAIEVPFAAGFEPMNPNLATSPPEATPEGKLTVEPDYSIYGDSSVIFYYEHLKAGTFKFFFRLKPFVEGTFTHPSAKASLMYKESVMGSSAGTLINIKLPEKD